MLIRNATLADGRTRDVRVRGETIDAVDEDLDPADEDTVDAADRLLLPGAIDAHVHFRQPGYGHKESWASGSRSAAAGGVTTVVDQPNTDPPTVDGAAFDQKAELAGESLVDFGINGGVTGEWEPAELLDRPLFALGEVFLADSTGDMGIDADLFEDALVAAAQRDVTVTVHAEDASLFNRAARDRDDADAWSAFRTARAEAAAVERACEVAAEHDARIHIAHTSTPEGIDTASDAGMTTEVTPHHLLLSRSDLDELGTHGRMNPPLRSEKRRREVYDRVVDGTVDMIATDHAPHTREEKDASIWDAPSGVPGVETMLPLLLAEARTGDLTYERVRDLVAANPADVFDLPEKGRIAEGNDADLVLVDTDDVREITGDGLHSNCGWTPFEGFEGVFPKWTMVRGTVVYDRSDDEFTDQQGENVRA
ncbi:MULTISPECIES: dihydroorotase [Halomicrobium]|uniref:Dihydroorotase n=2 Tax=Halomicrobium mukohataei TaxID=57705 RepID=C7NWY4_HALMD|nr:MULTISPECIES: dihydroorotase [Halomicrobium]ACV46349.1 dihydroorotase, multifunctional complex type [Halomicrobium mukohataei DSM 12286]QCD64904.1 dihydroorotase [Halomicrobium mukohataei]QFR19710.1 dihydroorotase [Halomicrobium sp. ZPS1]